MRVTIEKLAPTGEGIARTSEGVGFVSGTLPGEEVEAEVEELRKNFWKGRAVEVLVSSPQRVEGPHSSCAGCDWAHFDPDAALEAKRVLFLETMERIAGQQPQDLGALPAVSSPPRYRLRNRFQVSGTGEDVSIGYFVPRTHRVVPIADCQVVSVETVALLPQIREAIAGSGARAKTLALLEAADFSRRLARVVLERENGGAARRLAAELSPFFSGVRVEDESYGCLLETGARSLLFDVGGRPFPVSVDTFFQANRHLVGRLYEDVRDLARKIPPGRALDAFGGAGLFAGALLDAGHAVTTVEASGCAVRDADRARPLWADGSRWSIVRSAVSSFAVRDLSGFDLAVVDPPRAGLGTELASLLGQRVASRIIYVSCEPATLARDLPAIRARGFRLAAGRLYDLFAGTHRIEAVLVFDRGSSA